jgi:hypothetical protein
LGQLFRDAIHGQFHAPVYPATHPSRGRELAENPLIIFTLHSYTLAALKDETAVREDRSGAQTQPAGGIGGRRLRLRYRGWDLVHIEVTERHRLSRALQERGASPQPSRG